MKITLKIILSFFVISTLGLFSKASQIEDILTLKEEPPGVVFELIESTGYAWTWAAPKIRNYVSQLREKFPNIDLAIVSHGREQFSLTKKSTTLIVEEVSILKDMNKKDSVDISVCGTHSQWLNVSKENYLPFINVAESGPALINDYKNLGYINILLEEN